MKIKSITIREPYSYMDGERDKSFKCTVEYRAGNGSDMTLNLATEHIAPVIDIIGSAISAAAAAAADEIRREAEERMNPAIEGKRQYLEGSTASDDSF